ncbi:MKRN2 opposite strand protein isoform X2 [Ornithorhynchus anatinus]|uniref:MKRN2 opposite strand protein isoform X2 n=1 Tax=Ornithorhynchus anatinus TaxID=9258 RepID=UPI0010A8BBC1|nr:MKRN2 opposite strand protein isoform X2 [Ornithorhynchus anatinus]
MQPPAAGSPLVRFGHCGKAIYCFSVPRSCPLCGLGVGSPKLEDAPTSISSPFADGHRQRCAFLLRPTEGTFLRDYNGSSDLHVGITSTNGIVYNYNEKGVCRDGTGWEQSVSVPLVQPDLYGLLDRWNGYLEEFSATDDWLADRLLPPGAALGWTIPGDQKQRFRRDTLSPWGCGTETRPGQKMPTPHGPTHDSSVAVRSLGLGGQGSGFWCQLRS